MTVYTKTMMESLAEVRGLQEANMDLMRKAAGGAMQTLKMKDGKLQMDSFTASAIMQVFDKVNPANQKKMEQMINDGKKSGIIKLQKFAMSKVNAEYSEEFELDEGREKSGRQLVDPKREVMVVKKNKVIVIDKKDEDKYLKQGWELAEQNESETKYKVTNDKLGVWTGKARSEEDAKEKAMREWGFIGNVEYTAATTVEIIEVYEVGTDEYREYLEKLTPGQIEEEISELDELIKELDEGILGNIAKSAGKTVAKGVKSGAKKVGGAIKKKAGSSKIGKAFGKVKSGVKKVKAVGGKIKKAAKTGTAYGDEFNPMIERLEIIETKLNNYYKILEELDLEGVDLDEASARADAMRAMRKGKEVDPADVDTDATDDDVKGASKNIIMQMRKAVSLRGKFPVEFGDGKKVKIPAKVGQAVQDKYNSLKKPADKEKFQAQVAKSYKDMLKVLKAGYNEELELDEAKYELYHKDFSTAMQHAYKMSKKLHGITVKPSEIDDKVASGPRKPSEGKTNSYRLEGDRGAIQVQVYNKGGSKPYELNFYKEEVELDEGGMKRQLMKVSDFITTLINQGGMDKSDYEAARGYVEDGNMKGLAYMVKKLDTEPRDMIINAVAKGLGKKQAEQIFKVSIRRVEEVDLDEKKGSAGASLKDVMALDKKHAAHKKQSKKDQKRRDVNRASNRAAGMEEVEIDEAKPEFEVKYAKSKAGPFKVTKFMTLDQAKEFLADVKKDGMNGIISKGGKPVKEETILERIDRKLKERKNG